jgi:hypothetical protein
VFQLSIGASSQSRVFADPFRGIDLELELEDQKLKSGREKNCGAMGLSGRPQGFSAMRPIPTEATKGQDVAA